VSVLKLRFDWYLLQSTTSPLVEQYIPIVNIQAELMQGVAVGANGESSGHSPLISSCAILML
jgi:hypothetical protein